MRNTPTTGVLSTTNVHYLAAGVGPPVVLLHGLAAFKEIWWSTIVALSGSFHAVAFDWPGHGSSPVTDDYDFDAFAQLAAASCAALALGPITLVGHSMGGNIAVRLALTHPELVERLVLVAPALDARHLRQGRRHADRPPYDERAFRLLGRMLWPVALYGRRVPHNHRGGLFRPAARRFHYASRMQPRVLHQYSLALWRSSLGELLRTIKQPTLLLGGARDPLVAPQQLREAALLMPHAELRIVPGWLHNPMDERPAEFQAILLEYLQRTHAPAT
ncbi:MAG: alpha/beta fold hydrolase [Herpetosiphonaceae bacterium]|nr:alpha/beta fold hydrolase [Herpetosiphonaceae bacterium]